MRCGGFDDGESSLTPGNRVPVVAMTAPAGGPGKVTGDKE